MLKICALALLVAVAAGSFVDFLESIKGHSSFQRLPDEDKLLFGQLVTAAENNELTEFIDRVGLSSVLKLMDHMSQYDAERFAAYLAEHSNYTHHAHGHEGVIHKREHDHHHDEDHHGQLWNLLHGHYHSVQLPEQERKTLEGLMDAAKNHQLKRYIEEVGYGTVFGLLEFSGAAADEIVKFMTHAIEKETAAASKAKRDDDDDDHHSKLWNLLHGRYHSVHLPEQEQKILNDLMKAVHDRQVTQYIDQVGYGAIFGLLEFSGHYADDIGNMINGAIAAEAAAGRGKRQWHGSSGSHSSHGNGFNTQDFLNYFNSLNEQYFEHLPEQERKTYHDLKAAAEANNLTGYIAENGYGPIFGFLEHLDYFHANQVYDYLEKALESEKAAAAATAAPSN